MGGVYSAKMVVGEGGRVGSEGDDGRVGWRVGVKFGLSFIFKWRCG